MGGNRQGTETRGGVGHWRRHFRVGHLGPRVLGLLFWENPAFPGSQQLEGSHLGVGGLTGPASGDSSGGCVGWSGKDPKQPTLQP